ncbi:rhodanese-like domain-containing protein [Agaribacterium haliotis]|uniref:rhodanese-like domain-containing protein n=1 Tax=Agaribacterium haliotis TaxID=2013869 RepID=UPI000BB571EA|nr:rhodanese-like domain-containing protein [Agaribacterium haliotis]
MSSISAADFLSAQQQQTLTVIDLRTPAEVESEALGGCIALPVQKLNKQSFDKALEQAGHKQGPVYLLCQSGRRAQMAIDKLGGSADNCELVIIDGGLAACKSAGATLQSSGRKSISLERQVRIAAGFLVVLGVVLGATLSPAFFALSAFVGAGLMFAGITDTCGMAMLLAAMPWNRSQNPASKGAKNCSV